NNSTFFAMLRGTLTQDYVGSSTIIADDELVIRDGVVLGKGGQYTTQQNLSGYYSLSGFTTYGTSVKALRSNVLVSQNVVITRIPVLINDEKNYTNNRNLGLSLVWSSNISERIDYTLSSKTKMKYVKNSFNSRADNNYLNPNSRFSDN